MKKNIGNFALLVFWSLGVCNTSASANDLHDIRTGYHTNYSRVVIQLSRPALYSLQTRPDKTAATLLIQSKVQTRGFDRTRIEPGDAFLSEVGYRSRGQEFEIEIKFKQAGCNIEHRTLNSPFRIILDISPGTAPAQNVVSGREENSQPTSVAEDLPEFQDILAVLDSSRVIFSMPDSLPLKQTARETHKVADSDKAAVGVMSQDASSNRPGSAHARLDPYWLFVGAFLFLDLALLVWFLVRRRRSRPPARPRVRQQRRVDPNRPEMPSPEFLEFLKSAINEEKVSAPSVAPSGALPEPKHEAHQNARLGALVGSLADVLEERQVESAAPVPPGFSEIALDLNLGGDDLSEDEARRQLIGKDGFEFMKNIKKLYLN